jgi:hypothetical protein
LQLSGHYRHASRPTRTDDFAGRLRTFAYGVVLFGPDYLVLGDISNLAASAFADVSWSAKEASVVPLPAAAWLLVSGMGALGAFRRRRAAA